MNDQSTSGLGKGFDRCCQTNYNSHQIASAA